MARQQQSKVSIDRYLLTKIFLFVVGLFFMVRLFQIQVLEHSYYSQKAVSTHNKSYVIPAERGEIFIQDKNGNSVPLALNETFVRVIADPRYITNSEEVSQRIAEATGGDQGYYKEQLDKDTSYAVLEDYLDLETGEKVADLNLAGIALRDVTRRVYPEGSLAAHSLGFVNADGAGQYGIEQYYDKELQGVEGRLSGAFDVRGIPIAVADSIEQPALPGNDVVLTIDKNIQYEVERALKEGVERVDATKGSAVVMDPSTGEVKALANYPSYSPESYRSVDDIAVFTNAAISEPIEPGSVVKIFSMAAGLQSGTVTPDTTYLDRSCEEIDGFTICNTGDRVTKHRSMTETITRSANTGVIYVLKTLDGDDDSISREDKELLHDYYINRLHLGSPTNIELSGERGGVVDGPEVSDVRYANMTFGQGLSINMVQLAASLSSVINGGTYYKPHIVASQIDSAGNEYAVKPQVVERNVVSEEASQQLKTMMETVVTNGGGRSAYRSGYSIGGKTGSAQIANPEGGYYEDRVLGTFFGFAPSEDPQYVIVVRIDEPQGVFAGSGAAAPVFADISNWLIDYYGIAPKGVE
ncbi:TPA: penicillin-binding protein 2 [Candidatus Saccharibacteria bacterium]|nr:penicillin-binding protein 2 [Candidatus Saccharibacteria bacterium]HIO87579.1 penicillin-binding protein 2 [Candidatus Saccharibacteria bacterium]